MIGTEQERRTLQLHRQGARFLFADIVGAGTVKREGAQAPVLRLKHQAQAD